MNKNDETKQKRHKICCIIFLKRQNGSDMANYINTLSVVARPQLYYIFYDMTKINNNPDNIAHTEKDIFLLNVPIIAECENADSK